MSEKAVKKLYNGITDISEDMIEEAHDAALRKKRPVWVKWGAAAACLCAAAAGILLWQQAGKQAVAPDEQQTGKQTLMPDDKMGGEVLADNDAAAAKDSTADSGEGITLPPLEFALPVEGVEMDMLAFFIYQGRCYVQYEWLEDTALDEIAGEQLGTASGTIDEWTQPDSYVELSGSVGGDFYSVKGFDPSFMLCMGGSGGAVQTFVCNSGITLKTGFDLYEERLHLSQNYRRVQYETKASWHSGRGEVYELNDPHSETVEGLIQALDAAEFMFTEDVPLGEGESHIADKEIYQIYFLLENGMKVQLRLCAGGYVRFQGILETCVQLPEEEFEKIKALLQDSDAGFLHVYEGAEQPQN